MAFITWIMMKAGLAPNADDFARMEREFRERGHHAVLDFGSHKVGWTRWTDDEWRKLFAVGIGYEYLLDRRVHGVGFEALTQSLGQIVRNTDGRNQFYLGGGVNYYPIRGVRLLTQAGVTIDTKGDTQVQGRVGAGFRFMFFKVGMQPYFYVYQTSANQPGWAINFRFEY